MVELTVEMTYGSALYEVAKELGKENEILEEGRELAGLIESEEELKTFINYPSISAAEKKEVIRGIFEGKICTELLNFLYVLVDKRRSSNLAGIMKAYQKLMDRERGFSKGVVYSVVKLSDKRLAELEEQTSKLMNSRVKLDNEIDPKLIAGFKVLVEGKIIDASYRKRFDEMANQMNLS